KNEQIPAQVIGMAEGNERRARIIWIKLRLKQEFPMNFSEIIAGPFTLPQPPFSTSPLVPPLASLNPATFGSTSKYRQVLTQAGITAGLASQNPRVWPFESSACLLMALQQGRGSVPFTDDKVPPGSLAAWPAPNTTLKLLADSWDKPVVFYRWPAG